MFLKAPTIKCNLQSVRHKYFRSLNGVFGKIGARSPINVSLSLINAFCVPILTYGMDAFNATRTMYNVLDAAYSTVFFKIFNISDKHVIRQCQLYCGCLPISYVIDKQRMSFLWKFQNIPNYCMSVLFNTCGRRQLELLLNKYNLNVTYCGQIKSQMWSHFANSCVSQ